MNWIVTLAVLSVALSSTYAFFEEKEYGEALTRDSRIWHKKCVRLVGVTPKQIATLRDGIFEENDTIKITPDLEFNEDAFVKHVPKSLKNGTRNYKECFQEAKKLCMKDPKELVWSMLKCVYNRDIKHFIIF